MKNFYPKSILLVGCAFFSLNAASQTTAIPDSRFEQELINLGIDSDATVNGQILTADARAITELTIMPQQPGNYPDDYIHDLTGIEAFVNLERFTVGFTAITELNVSTMTNLKYLVCDANELTHIDVSSNTLLEEISVSVSGDLAPMNSIETLDLSHNPNIRNVTAQGGVRYINLKNGNNNENMIISIGFAFPVPGNTQNVCIEVDNEQLAQANQLPYSEWNVSGFSVTHTYTENCVNSVQKNDKTAAFVYPNPATDVLHIYSATGIAESVKLFDVSGRMVRQFTNITDNALDVSGLSGGVYLVTVATGESISTQKVIIN
nr:T9SS type A sorting domain-containing protein [uncultured Flavobacterium sp.]